MNSKRIINIWQKSIAKHKGSLQNLTDKFNSGHNWLMEMKSGVNGKFQERLIIGKNWSDSQISLIKNWAMDARLGQDQMLKINETERKEAIKILNELREKLDRVCVRANYGKIIGNSGEILGSSGAIIGSLMSLYGLPSGSDIAHIGNLIRLAGTFIDIASKIIESRFSEKDLKEVEARLRKDKEISGILEKLSRYAMEMEIDARIQAITGMSPASKKWNIVTKVCREFCKLASSGMGKNEALDHIKQGKYSKHIGNDVQIETLDKLYDSMSASPLLADRICSALSVLNIKPEYFKILIQILIVWSSFEDIYLYLCCKGDTESYSGCDSKCDSEGYSAGDAKGEPKNFSEEDPEVDSKSDPGGYSAGDAKGEPKNFSEEDPEVDSKSDPGGYSAGDATGDSESYSEEDPEDDPKITTARGVSYFHVFRVISLARSYNSLMEAASVIRRGVSQHSNVLKEIVEALNKKFKF